METKFTHGQWFVDNTGYFTRIRSGNIRASTVCVFQETVIEAKTIKANAHLIASAPAMYKALEALSRGECIIYGDSIETILAKARGE